MDIYIHIDCSSADTTRDIGRLELHSGRPHFVTKDVKIQSRGIFCGWMHYSHCNYIYDLAITVRFKPDDEIWFDIIT